MNMTEPARFRPAAILRGIDRRDAPTAKLVSWRAGGPAARVYQPADLADLVAFLRGLPPEEPVMFAGLGSNLLVRDGGLRGTLVLTHGALSGFAPDPRGDAPAGSLQWVAGAGVPCPKVARQTALHGCEGAEFLAGIPGTLGGALAMNAGCYGGQTWERVVRVTLITRDGQLVERLPGEFEVGYRHVALRGRTRLGMDEWFVEATLRLPRGDGERARARIREFLAHRHPAPAAAQRRLGIPQPAGRARGAPDRVLRAEGAADRWCPGIRAARELHRERRWRERSRYRGGDRAGARARARAHRRGSGPRGPDRRGARAWLTTDGSRC
jgi:UDP-N-acetylenolpyruvoylglucosamine reductase